MQGGGAQTYLKCQEFHQRFVYPWGDTFLLPLYVFPLSFVPQIFIEEYYTSGIELSI